MNVELTDFDLKVVLHALEMRVEMGKNLLSQMTPASEAWRVTKRLIQADEALRHRLAVLR